MKHLFYLSSLFLFTTLKASNYYVSTSTGDDSRSESEAQNPSTPWKTIEKINTFFRLRPGDSVLFKRGERFYGSLGVTNSGTQEKKIVYGSYGTGAAPVLSALSPLSTWTYYSGNIYYSSIDVRSLNVVTLDGVIQGMGRYPNTGYLTYSSHAANNSITATSIGSLPFDPTGGEVVIRKYRWVLDRHPVTSRSGNTLNYAIGGGYGNNATYSPIDGNGYFIQNNLNTLDEEGEWYYDTTLNRLYMHFGTGTPAGRTVKASSLEKNLTINSLNNIVFNNLSFEGGNINGGYIIGANNIILEDCEFNQQGGNGIYCINVSHITTKGGRIANSLNNGIFVEDGGNYITIDSTSVYNSGMIAGAGRSGDAAQEGIHIGGDNTTISQCSVINTGYTGINFHGKNAQIKNNFVDRFCTIKDDGGGIYSYISDSALISNNIILHAIGAFAGSEWAYWEPYGKAAGIYLDGGTANHNANVVGNTIAHGEWMGIFVNNNGGSRITGNLSYDFPSSIYLVDYSAGSIRNTTIVNNQFIAKTDTQFALQVNLYANDTISLFGILNNNIYTRPIDDDETIIVNNEYPGGNGLKKMSLSAWQQAYLQDANSSRSHNTVTDTSWIRFEYNYSSNSKEVSLDQSYVDVFGNNYSGVLTIPPFSSILLLKVENNQLLPLDLLELTGKLLEDNIFLEWHTADAEDVAKFEVERSIDGNHFEKLNTISFNSMLRSYTMTDYHPSPEQNLYRIKQISKNEKVLYSNVLLIRNAGSHKIEMYPNPAKDYLKIKVNTPVNNDDKISFTIKDLNGITIKELFYKPTSEMYTIDVSSLNKGMYILTYKTRNYSISKSIIKQ